MGANVPDDSIQTRLRLALRTAMKSKDTVAASALRSALAAIGNAEAMPVRDGGRPVASEHVAGGTAGLGATEAERRALTPEETVTLVMDEVSDRRGAARQYEATGHPERAERLRREARAIQSAIAG